MRLVIANSYPTRAHGIIVNLSGVISTTPWGQPRWIRGNLLMCRDLAVNSQVIFSLETFVCIMAKSQIKFSRAKKALQALKERSK